MKKGSIFLLLMSMSWLFSSCGALLSGAIDPANAGNGNFTATIDGKSWKADEVNAVSLFGFFTMTATKGEEEVFTVSFIPSQVSTGKSYSFEGEEDGKFAVTYNTKDGIFIPEKGSIRITSFRDNRSLEGEMDFESIDMSGKKVSVRNAKFKTSILL